jgi:WD40 repeat protein
VRIWDIATGLERVVLEGHTGDVVAVAPDGNWLVSCREDRTVRIWEAATERTQSLMRVDNYIFACSWLGSDALAIGGSAGLYLFNFLTGTSPPVIRP